MSSHARSPLAVLRATFAAGLFGTVALVGLGTLAVPVAHAIVEPSQPFQSGAVPLAARADASQPRRRAFIPTSKAFELQSRPGAPRVIYLDFRGGVVSGTQWNDDYNGGTDFIATPYSTDSDSSTFSTAERNDIINTWLAVAEDFAPFNVNVTTTDPGYTALNRSDSKDTIFGVRVLTTGPNPVSRSSACNGCGGIAHGGAINRYGAAFDYAAPAFNFSRAPYAAGAISHEVGHVLGLSHDGRTMPDGSTREYAAGSSPWSPIMGIAEQPVSQWSKGEYTGATQSQDDLAIIAKSFPLSADDIGNNSGVGRALKVAGAVTPVEGLIGTRTDIDAFTISGVDTEVTIAVMVKDFADLDVLLRVYDDAGTLIATANPPVQRLTATTATGLDASVTFTPVSDRTYAILVDGTGSGDPKSVNGYSDYGSLGRYSIAAVKTGK